MRKPRKALLKRFKLSGSKKKKPILSKVKSGQNHYNSGESGNVTRNKRRAVTIENKKQYKSIVSSMIVK